MVFLKVSPVYFHHKIKKTGTIIIAILIRNTSDGNKIANKFENNLHYIKIAIKQVISEVISFN